MHALWSIIQEQYDCHRHSVVVLFLSVLFLIVIVRCFFICVCAAGVSVYANGMLFISPRETRARYAQSCTEVFDVIATLGLFDRNYHENSLPYSFQIFLLCFLSLAALQYSSYLLIGLCRIVRCQVVILFSFVSLAPSWSSTVPYPQRLYNMAYKTCNYF